MRLINTQSGFEFDCQDTLEIMDLYVVFPDELTIGERNDAAEHMLACESCRNKYLQMKLTDTALRVNRDWLKKSGVFGEPEANTSQVEMSDKEISELRFEAMMDRTLSRRKRRERRERIARIKRLVKPVAAVAACIIAVLGIYLTASHLTGAKDNTPTIAAIPIEIPVKIELLTASAPKIIPAGQQIIALSASKTLRINDNRRMTLNPGTELSITPHNLGCVVRLEKGDIDTQVEHDGRPFIVETSHGRAVITGTIFNIKTNNEQMDLKVTEGMVRFESDKGFVNVSAGYTSMIAANSLPTMPVAIANDMLNETADQYLIAADAMLEYLDIPIAQASPVLGNIDYHAWVEKNRGWFKQQFPQIFRIKNALAKDDIEVDYPELLIRSGNLQRFRYPPASSTKLLIPNPAVLSQLAASFGKDQKWLTQTLSAINFANDTTTPKDIAKTNAVMFNEWLTRIKEANETGNFSTSGIVMESLHASIYLSKTRTLIWLTTAQTNPDAKELNILAEEIATAYKLTTKAIQLMGCEENNCQSDHPELLEQAIESINKIKEIERTITEYENISK